MMWHLRQKISGKSVVALLARFYVEMQELAAAKGGTLDEVISAAQKGDRPPQLLGSA